MSNVYFPLKSHMLPFKWKLQSVSFKSSFFIYSVPISNIIAANIKRDRLQSFIKFIQILKIVFKDLITLT